MSIQPEDQNTAPATTQDMWTDYSQYAQNLPQMAVQDSGSGYTVRAVAPTFRTYGGTSAPIGTYEKLWGKNGYYMNGPRFDPYNTARTNYNIVQSQVKMWTDLAQQQAMDNLAKPVIDRFSNLLTQYGHTNSPGVLLSIAQSQLDLDSAPVQGLLNVDAKVSAQAYGAAAPALATAPSAMPEASWSETFFAPIQFGARNLFAAMTMPVEGVQAFWRGAGGELTDESAPWWDMQEGRISGAVAQVGSFFLPPLSLWADRVRGDNNFTNPWEQTEFGSTLLAAAGGGGFDAFTTMQAGLDVERAKQDILKDPNIAALITQPGGEQEINNLAIAYAKQNNYYARPGWFIDETSQVGEAARQQTFRAWAIPNPNGDMTSWSLGKGIASKISGTDMTAFNVTSGLVDAAVAILFDPFTWLGGAGIPSKVVKATTGVVRGPENALLIGRELKKARDAQAAYNLNIAKVAKATGVSITDAGGLNLEETAQMVRAAKGIEATTEAQKLANPDTGYLQGMSRERYRSLANADRTGRYADLSTIAVIDPTKIDLTKAQSIWYRYNSMSFEATEDGGRRFSVSKFNDFKETFKNDPEATAIWNSLVAKEFELITYGLLDPDTAKSATQFMSILDSQLAEGSKASGKFDYIAPADIKAGTQFLHIDEIVTAAEDSVYGYIKEEGKRRRAGTTVLLTNGETIEINSRVRVPVSSDIPKPEFKRTTITQGEIDNSIDELYNNPNIDTQIEFSRDLDYLGVSSYDVPGKSVRTIGHTSEQGANQETLLAWLGSNEPILAEAADFIDDVSKQQIFDQMEQMLSGISREIVGRPTEVDSFVGQIHNVVADAANPLKQFFDLRNSTNLTWGSLLSVAAKLGVEGWLDNALRNLEEPIDGITGLAQIRGKGVWFGDNPNIRSYIIDREMVGDAVKVTSSPQRITGLSEIPVDVASASSAKWRSKAETIFTTIQDYAGTALESARRASDSLTDRFRELDELFADPEKALRTTVGYHAGLHGTKAAGVTVNSKKVREFLFGNGPFSFYANKTLDAISNFIPEADRVKAAADPKFAIELSDRAIGELYIVTNGKWDGQTYRELADNAISMNPSRDQVISILGPRMGIDVSAGDIARTTKAMPSDTKKYLRTWRTRYGPVARALGTMPTSRKVDLSSADEVADSIYEYGRYAKIQPDVLATIIGRVISAEGTMRSVGVNRNAIIDTFKIIGKTLVDNLDDNNAIFKGAKGADRKVEIARAMKRSVVIFFNGYVKNAEDDAEKLGDISRPAVSFDGSTNRFLTEDGNYIEGLDVNIDSELAHGFVTLPNVDDWNKALNRFTMSISRFPKGEKIYDSARSFFDNWFRTSLLVFRLSYIFRNIAEMQVRMYLNGHKSVLSDPVTMAGMVIGNRMYANKLESYAKKYDAAVAELKDAGKEVNEAAIRAIAGEPPSQSRLMELFKGYNQTILDDSFEVGLDKELAVANHIEDYWALLREANSLTDPRIYNSAVRQKWIHIEYGSPDFTKGWAHELIMLQRSKMAQLVLKGPVSGTVDPFGARSFEQMTVDALMKDPEYEPLRQLMIGADPKFETLFKDPVATMEYLFTNRNSVFNRIIDFTGNDPSLMGFLRTGVMKYGTNETLNLRAIPDATQRMNQFATVLERNYRSDFWRDHFASRKASVPWTEGTTARPGNQFFNAFFDWANKIERLTSVGPEFRMAYWDRLAELIPTLRVEDLDRARRAAKTTLGPINRMMPDGKEMNVGKIHPAFAAIDKAQKEGSGGMLTLDDLHGMAMEYAGNHVKELFYDAARRNKTWAALRLIFPFGQAWGNTVTKWTDLAAKKPIQVYKAQKALNALIEDGSSAIYDLGEQTFAFSEYAPGRAPWEQDINGGFFYTDAFGDTAFVTPFIGRAASVPMNMWSFVTTGKMTGVTDIPIQSPASSLNLALGADSIFPGIGPIASIPLSQGLIPDNGFTSQLKRTLTPFGEKDILASAIPPWLSKVISGTGSMPLFGDAIGGFVDALSPANKNKMLRDSMAILASSGNYPNWATDEKVGRELRDDAQGLSRALLLTTGLIQNFLPTTPYPQMSINLFGDGYKGNLEDETPNSYAIGMMNALFQQYRARNAGDETAAREEFVRDFGPAAIFATVSDWKNLSRNPTSQALEFAQRYPEIAKANLDLFPLFFPQGDSSDVIASMWINQNGKGEKVRFTKDEIFSDVILFFEQTQRSRVDFMEANRLITPDQAEAFREEIKQRYLKTGDVVTTSVDETREMERLNAFVNDYKEIAESQAGKAFISAWNARTVALEEARRLTGRSNAGLGGKDVSEIRIWFNTKIQELQDANPDFVLLANKFRREWD